jgi:hypothetical protein
MEKDPIGVLGMAQSSSMSSNSGLDRSTSGLGLSSRRLSRSDSSSAEVDAALDGLGVMMEWLREWLGTNCVDNDN